MENSEIPASAASRLSPRAHEDVHARRASADKSQSSEDSESASGYEQSSTDQSQACTPLCSQRSSSSPQLLSTISLSTSDAAGAPPVPGETAKDAQGKQQQPRAQKLPATAAASRAAAMGAAGTACLAPRRLRSKAPPRVAWVSGKFIRELGSDNHRPAELPGCASFVYSLCHVEGYDIRAVYQDALQKHVWCRLMDENASVLMLEVADCLHLADPKVRSQEAFEATCRLHVAASRGSQLDALDGLRSCASAVLAGDDSKDAPWNWQSPPTNSQRTEAPSCSFIIHDETSSEVDAAAAAGARSLRRGMRSLSSNRYRCETANATLAFIFARGPVIIWIAASDARARDSRGRRELLSSFLFFLSQFATRFVRADMVQEDVMQFAYIWQVRKRYPSYEIPKSRILQDCIYLKTESVAEKLSASFALSQSIRLSVYESLINFTIARVRSIPERMARFGSADEGAAVSFNSDFWLSLRSRLQCPLVRAYPPAAPVQPLAWSCLCGDLLGKVVDVNIVQDFRDIPEYFWNDDTWQHFWRRLYGHLDIQKRIDLLNNRYFCIHELLKVVREERRSRQEFRLTWIVVILLFFQVVAMVLRNFVIRPYEQEGKQNA